MSGTDDNKRAQLLELFKRGPQSVPSICEATGRKPGGVYNTLSSLLVDGLAEYAGNVKNPSPLGGQPIRMYCLPGWKPPVEPRSPLPKFMPVRISTARTVWKPKKARTHSGSGQIAGPITVPQFRWNGTRLG